MWANLAFHWRACLDMAWEAYCAGSIPIGAVIANSASGCILSAGRNRMREPRGACLEHLAGVSLAHAEINALLAFSAISANPRECTLYTTTEPCPMCAGAIVMANVRRVCFAARDPWAGSTNLFDANPYLAGKHIQVEPPTDLRLEAVLFVLQSEYSFQEALLRGSPDPLTSPGPVLSSMARLHPAADALSRRLFLDRSLPLMRDGGYPAREMVDTIAARLE